jgi:hypothetical protein
MNIHQIPVYNLYNPANSDTTRSVKRVSSTAFFKILTLYLDPTGGA